MKNSKLDFRRFYPEVYQVVAGNNYVVYAYMNDGNIRAFDVKPLIKKGGIFSILENENLFREKLTVLNDTIAWDIGGNRDASQCIDIDPMDVFDSPVVSDIPNERQ